MSRTLSGLATMVAGGLGTLGILLLLNSGAPAEETKDDRASTAFEVPPPPPPKIKPKPKPKPRQRQRVQAPPAPMVGSSLSGLDLGLSAGALLGDMAAGLLGDTSGVVMTEDAVDQPPRPTSRPAGPYPPRARARGITGRVLLRVLVKPDGTVGQLKVEDAEPEGVFEEAALDAVTDWTFEPGRYHGTPVPAWIRVPVRFELEG